MEIAIHPKIWKYVVKMYDTFYKNNIEIKNVLLSLQLTKDAKNVNGYDLEDFLKSLSFHDAIKVIRDILMVYNDDLNDQFEKFLGLSAVSLGFGQSFEKIMQESEIRQTVKRLINSLKENGLEYDFPSQTFSRNTNGEGILILPPRRQLNSLIDFQFEYYFYDRLKDEINMAYKYGLFNSVSLLCRKMIQDLVYEILRLKYPANIQTNLEMYYNQKENRQHDFTLLIKNLEDKKDEYGIDKDWISEFISLVKPFRPTSNSNAHSIIKFPDEEEILEYKVPKMISLLIKLRDNLKRES
jgi:hypothetical protein